RGPEVTTTAARATASTPVIVAVVDSGVDAAHPLLASHLLPGLDLRDGAGSDDANGHGSHVAGIIARADPMARILPLKVTDPAGGLDLGAAAHAIVYAADHGAKVINLSWIYMGSEPEVHDAIVYAGEHGALVATAPGATPASIKNALLASCAPSPDLTDKVVCGGSL